MRKQYTVQIDQCRWCKHYEGITLVPWCSLLNHEVDPRYIPDDCPLEDAEEAKENN